ncbi:MAG: hypothetical protein IKT98_10875 [Selenomonadaceae bacterium]|nr:hypothetical protein [Selenomonadaceae bacterium]
MECYINVSRCAENGHVEAVRQNREVCPNHLNMVTFDYVLSSRDYFMADKNNDKNNTVVSGTANADYIVNTGTSVTVNALDGDDTIDNSGEKVSISGGAGSDSIDNSGTKVTIDAGSNNDYIFTRPSGSNVLVKGGSGNDTLENYAEGATLDGGDGADFIESDADKVSINGGGGDDSIRIYGNNITVNTSSGNDIIGVDNNIESFTAQGFGLGDTIQLSYAIDTITTVSGGIKASDVTIFGVSKLSTITSQWSSVKGGYKYVEKYSEGATTSEDREAVIYRTAGEKSLFTITGVTSTGGIKVDDMTVTVSKSALGTVDVSISGDYVLNIGDDVKEPQLIENPWFIEGSVAAYKEGAVSEGYVLENYQIKYVPAVEGTTTIELTNVKSAPSVIGSKAIVYANNFSGNVSIKSNSGEYEFELDNGDFSGKTFYGSKQADTITNNGSNIIINGNGSEDLIDNHGSKVTINGGEDEDTITSDGSNVSIYGYTGNDLISVVGGSTITVDAGSGNDTIKNEASYVTIDGNTSNDEITTSGNNVSISGGKGKNTIYVDDGTNVIVNVDKGDDLVWLGNVKSLKVENFSFEDTIQLGLPVDSLDTVSNGIVANGVTITGVTASKITSIWEVEDGVAKYSESYSEGATLSEDKEAIVYRSAGGASFFTIGSINSTTGIAAIDHENKIVTLAESALNKANVTINNDYTLQLADGVKGSMVADIWVKNGANYAYKVDSTIEGYDRGNTGNEIDYTAAVDGETYVELNGVKITENSEPSVTSSFIGFSADDFSGNVLSVVSNSNGYSFELGADDYSGKTFSGATIADTITNYGNNISISSGAGNDYIYNEGKTNISIDGGAGNDSIENWGDSVTVSGGIGDDSILNNAKNVLFVYSGGNDTITGVDETSKLKVASGSITSAYSNGTDAILVIGENKLTLENFSKTANQINLLNSFGKVETYTIPLLKGTDAADDLSNPYSKVTIQALGGDDTIDNEGDNVTIDGGAGKDNIDNSGNNVSINGGEGNDFVNITGGKGSTVNVSTGNDTIAVNGSEVSFKVEGFKAGNEIQLAIPVSSLNSAVGGVSSANVTITGLTVSKITPSWESITGGAKYVEKYSDGAYLSQDGQTITYKKSGDEATLFSLGGVNSTSGLEVKANKTVVVSAAALNKKTVTIDNDDYSLELGKDVKETVAVPEGWAKVGANYAYKTDSTLAGYELEGKNKINYVNDTEGEVILQLSGLSITADNEPFASVIKAELSATNFAGDVKVISNIYNSEFELNAGDYGKKTFTATAGNDLITNNGTSLQVVTGAGNDSIENKGAKSSISAGAGNDTINNNSDNVSISGDEGNDLIENYGNQVTITGSSGNDKIINNYGDNVLFQYVSGNDIIEGFDSNSTLQLMSGSISSAYSNGIDAILLTVGENTITLRDLSKTTNVITVLNAGASKAEKYTINLLKGTEKADDIQNINSNVTINALGGNDSIENSASKVTINAGGGDDYIYTRDGSTVQVFGDDGNDTFVNWADEVSIAGGAGNDSIENWGDNISINGGAGTNTIELTGGTNVSINVSAGNDSIALGGEITKMNIAGFSAGDEIYMYSPIESFSAISNGVQADNLTIMGLNAAKITPKWSLTKGVGVYSEKFTTGARLDSDRTSIKYTTAGESSLFTISGIASTVGVDIDDLTITLSKSALSTVDVSVSGDYTLDLAEDVSQPTVTSEMWYLDEKNSTATYKGTATVAGYTVENNVVKYTSETDGKTLLELGGIKIGSESDTMILGNTVYLSPTNFAGNITVKSNAGGYEFEFLEGKYSNKTFYGSKGNENIANNKGTSLKFDLGAGNDSIYSESSKVTISTGTGNDSITNNGANVSINAGDGNDLIENNGEAVKVTINTGAGNDSIYNGVGNDSIKVSLGAGKDSIENWGNSVTINGGDGNDYIYNYGENVTLTGGKGSDTLGIFLPSNPAKNLIRYSADDGNDVVQVINQYGGANIEVDLVSGSLGGHSSTDDAFILQIDNGTSVKGSIAFQNADREIISLKTSADENYIWNGGDNATIKAGGNKNFINNKAAYVTITSGAGNDFVTISPDNDSSNTFAYSSGSGSDVIYNFGNSDTIKIADDSKFKVKIKKNDVVFKVGTSSITLKDAAKNNTKVTIADSKDESISTAVYTKSGIISDETLISLLPNFSGTYTATDEIKVVDASKVLSKVKIKGNESADNSLVGGTRNDTLSGSFFDDSLTGGKGSDVFIYNGGSDIITDYSKNDKISVGSGFTLESYTIDGKNVVLDYGAGNSLTINNSKDKAVTFIENKKKVTRFYTADGILDGKKKVMTLMSTSDNFSAKKYTKLTTIDGTATNTIKITGNGKANVINAGAYGSSLDGGKGKDTLIGGKGKDVFIYEKSSGKDVIQKYSKGDVVKIGSGVEIKDGTVKKGNSVIKVKGGSITVEGTKTVTLTSGKNNDTIFSDGLFIDKKNSAIKVYSSYKGTIDLSKHSSIKTADASLATKKLTLKGTAAGDILIGGKGKDSLKGGKGADSLVGGKGNDELRGEAGKDTLWGGKGNDSLWGGADNDTFIFYAGEGTDTIMDYAKGDMLKILNKKDKAVDFSSATFNSSKGTLTLSVKGGGKVIFADVSSSTSININGKSKTVGKWIK